MSKINVSALSKFFGSPAAIVVMAALVLVSFASCRTAEGDTNAEKRKHIQSQNTAILNAVYADHPEARKHVSAAAGYGTFSNIETKMGFIGSGNGYGQAVDSSSGKVTFMTMRKLGVGVGAGVQELQLLVIFKDPAKFDAFAKGGWQLGGGADASIDRRDMEGAEAGMEVTAELDPMIYQITEAGVNVSATVEGVKYSLDDELN